MTTPSELNRLAESVKAATDFDPDRCPWCGAEGFDLRGLAQHVWMRCDVVERLAEENIEDCRRSHQRFHEAALRARDEDREAASKARADGGENG